MTADSYLSPFLRGDILIFQEPTRSALNIRVLARSCFGICLPHDIKSTDLDKGAAPIQLNHYRTFWGHRLVTAGLATVRATEGDALFDGIFTIS